MKCPVCDETMREIEKQGVKVDICPSCKGIWLDRGELEKLISASSETIEPGASHSGSREMDRERHTEHDHKRRDHDHDDDHEQWAGPGMETGQRRRRGSWLGDILGGLGGD